MTGRGDRAWEYFRQLIPHNIIRKIGVETYRAEPYAWCSNIVGPDNPQFGWGNVNQITGTAPWMDVAATQYLLGVRPTLKGLLIDPVLPSDWDAVTVDRIFRGCLLHIQVVRSADGPRLAVNGAEMPLTDGEAIIPADFCREHSSAEILYRIG